VRLLLDEMYPAAIAAGLRQRGTDVAAVTATVRLRNMPDDELFAVAQIEQRAVVTENVRDFIRIADSYDRRRQAHHGLVLVHWASYPRGRPRTIGAMVTALAALCREDPGDEPTSFRHWL
jgi:hypothetical protein